MKQMTSILFYVEDELDSAALNRAVELAESAGVKLTLGAVVKPARSQVLFTRDSFDLDEVTLESVPRIVWSFKGALRRIAQKDEYPLVVTSVRYPTDTYDLRFRVVDVAGKERFRESKILLVSDEYPIEFSPRLSWARHRLPRGIYTVVLDLTEPEIS